MPNRIWLDFSGSNCDLNQVPSLSLIKGWYLNSNESVQIFPHMTDVPTAIGTARNPDGQVVEQMTNKTRHSRRRAADMIERDWIRVRSQILQQSVLANNDAKFLMRPTHSVFEAIAKPAKARCFIANSERQSLTQSPQKRRFTDSGRSDQQDILLLAMQPSQFLK